MLEKNIKNVLFDLDGTVLDTLPDLVESANHALVELGYPSQSYEPVHTRPYDGMPELIRSLKESGKRVFVISNKYDDAAKELVKNFYGELFDGIYGSTDDMLPKPDRAVFDKVCKENSLDPKECIYVGDSEVDVQFANNCGIPLIAVCWGFRTRQELVFSKAATIASDIRELKRFLQL